MKLEKKELKIFYKGKINPELDKALKDILNKFKYKEWASGFNICDGIRDLCFDKKEDG